MLKIYSIALLGLLMVYVGCKKDTAPSPLFSACPYSNDSAFLAGSVEGNWKWVQDKQYSRRDPEPIYTSPETAGYTMTLSVRNGTATFAKNSTPDSTYPCAIIRLGTIPWITSPQDSSYVLVTYSPTTGLVSGCYRIGVCDGYMLMSFGLMAPDGGERVWKR